MLLFYYKLKKLLIIIIFKSIKSFEDINDYQWLIICDFIFNNNIKLNLLHKIFCNWWNAFFCSISFFCDMQQIFINFKNHRIIINAFWKQKLVC